ncbi:unnamed protein product [Heterobilharzia americana]|nr:unnamed protein product [Heterobilharzia americana]
MLGSTSANASHQNSFNNLSKASRQCRQKLSECTMKRAATKRKQSSSLLDTLDLENPDSILTKVNLKPNQVNSRRSSLVKSKNLEHIPSKSDSHLHNSSSTCSVSSTADSSVISPTASSSTTIVKSSQNKKNRSTKLSQSLSDNHSVCESVCSPSSIRFKDCLKKPDCPTEANRIKLENDTRNKSSSPNVSELCPFHPEDALDTDINNSVRSFDGGDLGNGEDGDSCIVSDGILGHSLSLGSSYNGTLTSPTSSIGDSNRSIKLCDKTLECDNLRITDSPLVKQTHARRLSLDSKLVNSTSGKQSSASTSRSARPSRSSNPNSSTASPSMPPPRQTKTLAAMREKLRAKRMLKESERGIISQRFYGLPGSMTPHPASGSSGYFQNRNYSTCVNFLPLSEIDNKQSVCVTSPSAGTPMSSPVNDRNMQSVNLSSLLSETQELVASNLASESPRSPHSAPSIDVMSPLLPLNSTSVETTSTSNNLDNYTCYSNSFAQSYPSSPHLTNSNMNINLQHSLSSHSPSPIHPSQTYRLEQSVSAPPTPSNPQSGQNFTNYLHQSGPSFPSPGPCFNSSASLRTSQVSPVVSVGSYPSPVFTGKCTVPSSIRPSSSVLPDSHFTQNLNNTVPSNGSPTVSINHGVPESLTPFKSVCQTLSTFVESVTSVQATMKSVPSLDTISISPLTSVSSVTKLLTSNSRQNRSSTTTRAFFVDGDNLSEAVAFLQSLNPKATITQQQFLLIPGANKSQMFLCRAPVTCSSEAIPSCASTKSSVSVSHTSQTSWAGNVSLVSNSGTPSTGSPSSSTSSSIVLNDVPSSTCSIEKSCLSGNTSATDSYRHSNFYMTTCNDVAFPKVVKTSSDLQIPRSLVYSKSINVSASNGPSFPLNILISHPKVSEASSERPSLLHVVKSVSSHSKLVVPPSANSISCPPRAAVPTVLNYKQPVSHSQLNLSLLTPGPSVISNEVPILFVQDRNQHPVNSQTPTRPVNWVQHNSFDQHTDLTDRPSISLPILPTATVITTHANNTSEFRCFPHPVARSAPSMQIPNNVPVSSHFGFQSIQSVQPPNPTVNSLGPTPFLSGPTATIMSPCLPAVILSHPISIQSTSNVAPASKIFLIDLFLNQHGGKLNVY